MVERSSYHIVVWTRKGPLLSKTLESVMSIEIVLLLKSSYILMAKTMKT